MDSFLLLYRFFWEFIWFIARIVRFNFVGKVRKKSMYFPVYKGYESPSHFNLFYIFKSPYLAIPNDNYIINFHDVSSFCQMLASLFSIIITFNYTIFQLFSQIKASKHAICKKIKERGAEALSLC